MADLPPLWVDREAIWSTAAGSTTHRAGEVAELLLRTLANAERTALRGPQNARSYSARVRAGIRRAVGPLPAHGRVKPEAVLSWIAEKGPEFFGLQREPDIEIVRDEIKQMEAERG